MILDPKKIKSVTISIVSPSICHEVMDKISWSYFYEYWVSSQLFESPLWLSSRGPLVILQLKNKLIKQKLNIQKTKIIASGPITSWQTEGGKLGTVTDFIFLGSKVTVDGDDSHKIKTLAPWKKNYDKPRQYIKMQRYHFADKCPYNQSYFFSSSHV